VFARLMYPPVSPVAVISVSASAFGANWKEGMSSWTTDYPAPNGTSRRQ